jgi:biopolymer transport protein ExbB
VENFCHIRLSLSARCKYVLRSFLNPDNDRSHRFRQGAHQLHPHRQPGFDSDYFSYCVRLSNPGPQAKVAMFVFDWSVRVLAIIEAAGWPIWPLILASVLALAIIIERFYSLRVSEVSPPTLLGSVVKELQGHGVSSDMLTKLATDSPLGQILAAGLRNVKSSREVMKESIEEAGRAVVHDLERFLTSLGTIAAVAPLLGLFGTVVGMIEIFGSQTPTGGNPAVLAHGISVALYNTAFGLIVAIPAMIFYRFFRTRVDNLAIEMEQQAIKLVEIVHGERI